MQNYFNYFTEIEEHFQRRRGSLLMISTLDWALIETWREAQIPLAAVLRGIDNAFDRHDARQNAGGRSPRRVNGLAWCSQAVMQAAETMQEAAIGLARESPGRPEPDAPPPAPRGFEPERIAKHVDLCARALRNAPAPSLWSPIRDETASTLDSLAGELRNPTVSPPSLSLEELDRRLLVLDERLVAAVLAAEPPEELVLLKTAAARELAPYRSRMQAMQIRQVEQQFLHKRLLDKYRLPRLSLFYMSQQ